MVVQPARDDGWWLWTITPRTINLAESLSSSPEDDNHEPLLASYGRAAADVVRTCLHHGFTVSVDPKSFGVVDGSVCYIGDVGVGAPPSETWFQDVLDEVKQNLRQLNVAVDPFVTAFSQGSDVVDASMQDRHTS